jgi:type IV pilus assembly protein PilE
MVKSENGFHLIEVLTTVAIMSILITLCLPLYSQYLVQARRLEAASTLSRLAVAMEKFHIEHNTYQGATLVALHFSDTIAKNNYQLRIQSENNDYILLAQPIGKQAEKDTQCAGLILYANGKQAITGNSNVSQCW